jgi:hypothetical protein
MAALYCTALHCTALTCLYAEGREQHSLQFARINKTAVIFVHLKKQGDRITVAAAVKVVKVIDGQVLCILQRYNGIQYTQNVQKAYVMKCFLHWVKVFEYPLAEHALKFMFAFSFFLHAQQCA